MPASIGPILEGSVRRSGNRIRVTAELIDAQDGYHLWSQRYDRGMADIFDIQDEIAAAIAGALQVKLASAAERYKPSLPAYEALLMGRHQVFKLTPRGWEKAKECYEQAIALDPKFALAYAEMAGLLNQAVATGMQSPREIVPQTRVYAEKALELDPSLPEAHIHLGTTAIFEYDWKEAGRRFTLAISEPTVSPLCRFLYSNYLHTMRRALEAVKQVRRSVVEDPVNPVYRPWLAPGLWITGRDEGALREAKSALEIDDSHPTVLSFLALYHLKPRRFSRSPALCREVSPASASLPAVRRSISRTAGSQWRSGSCSGNHEQACPAHVYGVPRAFVYFHLVTGEIEKAADWFERAMEQRDFMLPLVSAFLSYKPLRESPRWPKLAKMMNLPEGV